MKKFFCILLLMSAGVHLLNAQSSVAIGDANTKASAVLYLKGNGNQGFIIPIVTNTSSIPTPEAGMIVYNSTDKNVYYHNGSAWAVIGSVSGGGSTPILSNGQLLTGNGTTNAASTLAGDATLSGGTITISNNAITSAKIADGTIAAADLNAMSATSGQVLKFNGTAWAPAADAGGVTYTGGAGITVAGTVISNIGDTNAADDITTASVAAGDVTGSFSNLQIASDAVTTTEIANGTIAATDLSSMSATNGQVLKFNGTSWVPSADDVGGGATPTLSNGQILTGNGTSNAASTLGGDATLSGGTITISNNAVTSIKIVDGSIVDADITSVAPGKITQAAATTGQVLKWNGTAWAPAADAGGAGTVTAVSVATANGFSGTSSGGATPALTLTTPVNGIIKGNGTAMSAAVAGTDYLTPTGSAAGLTGFPTLNQNTTGTASTITGTITQSQVTNLTTDLANKVTANGAITPGTNTKITYDAKGLVTAGAALTASDLPVMTATVGGAVPTPPNNTTTFLRGDGTFATPAGGGTVTAVSVATANGFSGTSSGGATPALTIVAGAITPTSVAATGTVTGSNLSGTNTGDNAVNTLYSGLVSNATHTGDATGATALTVRGINGVLLSGLGTGILKNTTGTGVPSIATGADLPVMTATVGGAVPTPPNNTTTFLRGDGTFATPTGGMTNPLTTTGDIIYGVGTTPTRLAGATGVLKSTGAAAPAWGAVNLANTDVTGVLPVANGGTGGTTWNGLLLGSGSTIGDISTGTAGQILRVVGTTPTWSNFAVTSADITDGQIAGADLATNISIATTGNITTNAPGSLSIAGTSTLTGATTLASLSGVGTRMVVADAAGLLSTSSVPTVGWGLSGNSGTTFGTNFIGTTDNIGLSFKTNNLQRMYINNLGQMVVDINNTNPISAPVTNAIMDIVPNGAGIGNMVLRGSFANQNDPVDIEFRTWNGATTLGRIFMNPSAADMWFDANGATRLTLQNDGDVGIGTTNPVAKLDVAGSIKITDGTEGNLKVLTSDANGLASWQPAGAGSGWTLTGNGGTTVGTNFIGTTNNVGLSFKTNSVERIRILNTGSVGIGTITPSQTLDVVGNITIGTANSYYIGAQEVMDNAGTANIFVGGNNASAGQNNSFFGRAAGSLNTGNDNTFIGRNAGFTNSTGQFNTIVGTNAGQLFATGNGNTIVGFQAGNSFGSGDRNTLIGRESDILTNGITNATAIGYLAIAGADNTMVLGAAAGTGNEVKVGIGLTTPTTELHVTHGNGSPAAGNGLTIQNVGASNQNFALFVSNSTGNLNLYDNTTFVGGFAQVSGTYTPVSDRRFKKNIVSIEEVLPKLSEIKIRRYHFKKQQDDEPTNIGVIAQELKEIYPEMVHYSPESDRYTVDYQSMGPLAIKAIQEQQKMIEMLKAKISGLESSLANEQSEKNELKAQLEQLSSDVEQIRQTLGLDKRARKD